MSEARFLTGSTLRHVIIMSASGSAGLMFMFMIDFATLFWIGYAGTEAWIAAAGFAFTVQFFTISSGLGFMIAATALISQALGRGDDEDARRIAAASAVMSVCFQSLLAAVVCYFRLPILALIGAEGEVLDAAGRFLMISVPSLPFMALSMIGSATLRAAGDATRMMLVTFTAGFVAMIVDPFLILGLGMGLDGAAIGVVVSRLASACVSLYFVLAVHNMIARPSFEMTRKLALPFIMIAGPAILTQLSTPVGNAIATRVAASFGDGAVAGFSIASRVAVLAFGGVFALSGAIGGIIGQNFGAGFFDRVKSTYLDALRVNTVYVVIAGVILIILTPFLIDQFKLGREGAQMLWAFSSFSIITYGFQGALFTSNAAFNNLERPILASLTNWGRDGLLMWPLCFYAASAFGIWGLGLGLCLAQVISGSFAVLLAYRFIQRL